MSETVDDMKRMQTYELGDKIIVDMTDCRFSHSRQIALYVVIREQYNVKGKARPVDVLLSGKEMKCFRVSDQIDALALHRKVLSDRVLENFTRM